MSSPPDLDRWTPRLLDMEAELGPYLPGDPEPISRLAKGIRKRIALFPDRTRPLGCYLAIGARTKTSNLARGLGRFLFGNEDAVLDLGMSDYSEKHQIISLIGHPGGFVCAWMEGALTEPVRQRPAIVLLLHDFDRIHPEFLPAFLEILEHGLITDGLGRSVPFRETLLLLGTSVGCDKLDAEPDIIVTPEGQKPEREFPVEIQEAIEVAFPAELLRYLSDVLLIR